MCEYTYIRYINNYILFTYVPAFSGRGGGGGGGSWLPQSNAPADQGWAKLVLIALERYSVALKRLTFNLR
jgi:hypothetical protein